ncbi:MAG: hypothetical protein ACI9QQ_001652, partial [Myxococcota bacterium]
MSSCPQLGTWAGPLNVESDRAHQLKRVALLDNTRAH